MAQEQSHAIKASKYDSSAAAYTYKSSRAERWPTLSLSGRTYYVNTIPTAGFIPGQSFEIGSKDNYQFDLKLSAPLFTGGRLTQQINLQSENIRQKSYQLQLEKLQNAYNCRRAYLNLMLSQTYLSLAETSLKRIEIIENNISNLYDNGLADSLDLLETKQAMQQALRKKEEKITLHNNGALFINDLLGLSAEDVIEPADNIIPPDPKNIPAEISTDQIARPELDIIESSIRSANYSISLNRAVYFPTLSGYVGYSYGKPNREYFGDEWNDNFIVGANLDYSFNLGGKSSGSIKASKQSALAALSSRDELRQSFILRARQLRENLNLAYKTYLISAEEQKLAKDKYRLAESKQQAGQMTVNRLLELETDLTSAEQQYNLSIINFYLAKTDFLYSIGSPDIYGGL